MDVRGGKIFQFLKKKPAETCLPAGTLCFRDVEYHPPPFPLASMGLSGTLHLLGILWIFLSPLLDRPAAAPSWENRQIVYYQLSQGLPDISPFLAPVPVRRKNRRADKDALTKREVMIHPELKDEVPRVIEQPLAPRLARLPVLELPNLVYQPADPVPPMEPLRLQALRRETEALSAHWERPSSMEPLPPGKPGSAKEIVRFLAASAPLPAPQLKVPEAASPGGNPASPLGRLSSLPAMGPEAPRPVLKVPEAPSLSSSIPLSSHQQLPARPAAAVPLPLMAVPEGPGEAAGSIERLDQVRPGPAVTSAGKAGPPPPLLRVPTVESAASQGIPGRGGSELLVYSTKPGMPLPDLKIPLIHETGRIGSDAGSASREEPDGLAAALGSPLTMPGITLREGQPGAVFRGDLPIVQGPPPPLPAPEGKASSPAVPVARASIPARPLKLPGSEALNSLALPGSPLSRAERQGERVFTARIMAPNFSSRKGLWTFRFSRYRPGAPPVAAQAGGSDPSAPDADLSAPSALVQVDPRYPPEVMREKIEGLVILFAIIGADGVVEPASVMVVRKLDARLDAFAREALLQWKFKPSRQNGIPVAIQAEISIPFYFRGEPDFRLR